MKKIVLLLMICVVCFSGCVTHTNVLFKTENPGAKVYIDHVYIGETPVTKRISNAIWEDPDIMLKMEGYTNIRTGLDKEIKPVNLIFGLILWWPSLLWVYGPDPIQYYTLEKE
jgi:hypothetical protein